MACYHSVELPSLPGTPGKCEATSWCPSFVLVGILGFCGQPANKGQLRVWGSEDMHLPFTHSRAIGVSQPPGPTHEMGRLF